MRRHLLILILVVSAAIMLPHAVLAGGAAIIGEIQGASCITTGYRCPVDKVDPYVVLEADFVLLTAGGDYYFLTNLDRAVKARYIGETVKVTGKVTGRAVMVETFEAKRHGKFKVVWSREMQRKMWEERLRN